MHYMHGLRGAEFCGIEFGCYGLCRLNADFESILIPFLNADFAPILIPFLNAE